MRPILEVRGLWKEYIRALRREQYLSIRDSVLRTLSLNRKNEKFWALRDISFDVYPGDSVAIIGHNGAGKSTLLKVLSRITAPTRGEVILRGRLSSLLEVGTGFHMELTGRENIYLNGSILGLNRIEIKRQFDAIVDFAGTEQFLDTTLKHYSSGMQLRLAFAVAAHLEPEILVIDEVLAVGDSAFQQKCIEKMTQVSQNGRTILFVSHNMQAIVNLCKDSILIESGQLKMVGATSEVLDNYLQVTNKIGIVEDISQYPRFKGKGDLIFHKLYMNNLTNKIGEEIRFSLQLKRISEMDFYDLDFGIALKDQFNSSIIHLSNRFINKKVNHKRDSDIYTFSFVNNLKGGNYRLILFLRANDEIQDWITTGIGIELASGNIYGFNNSNIIQGVYQPNFDFEVHTYFAE